MNASTTDAYEIRNESQPQSSWATILTGLTLLAIGIAWLLDASGVLAVSWYVVFAITLMTVGLGLVIGSFSGEHGGLIALGIVLTVLLTGAAWSDVRFEGGIGDRTAVPASYAELESSYRLGAGTLVLDLRQVDFPAGETTVAARVGAGELHVYVPDDLAVSVDWRVVAGDVKIFGYERSGVLIEDSTAWNRGDESQRRLTLDLIVTAGTIEVRQ